jgi:hypothetical protein
VQRSKTDRSREAACQASNAATLLHWSGVNLVGRDWSGVQIPGADLRYGVLAEMKLSGADLRGAYLTRAMLYHTDLSNAKLQNVHWGEEPKLTCKDDVNAIAYHPREPWLAVAEGKVITFRHGVTGEVLGEALTGHTWGVRSVSFSPDGRLLASSSRDNTVRLWTVETRAALGKALTGHMDYVTSVSFSPDGRLLASSSDDGTVRLWTVETGAALGEALTEHTGDVTSVSFSPDGRLLASSSRDNTVRLWTVETRAALGEALTGHRDSVLSVSFSPDDRLLASSSADNTVRLWGVDSQRCLRVLSWPNAVYAVAFSEGPLIRLLSQPPSQRDKAEVREGKALLAIKQSAHQYALGFYSHLSHAYEQKILSEELVSLLMALPPSSVIQSRLIRTALLKASLTHGAHYAWPLTIGDGVGRVSVGSVFSGSPSTLGEPTEVKGSETGSPQFQLLSSSRHPQALLWTDGAEFKGCQMSRSSRRLLEQSGARVSEVVVEGGADLIEKSPLLQEEKHRIHSPESASCSRSS